MYPRIMVIFYSTFEVKAPLFAHSIPFECYHLFFLVCMHAESLQLCLTLFNPMDRSPICSSVHEVIQARTLE